ncbi:MAG: glycosyltransferase family 4 protein [Clostridia bacterium]|nr:glycosyltransferase family 4 protein [Clostridia bacterium]
MREERRALGYGEADLPPYVLNAHISDSEKEKAAEVINRSDAVIFGSADEIFIKKRKENSGLVFRYSERIFKKKKNIIEFFRDGIGYRIKNPFGKPVYLLCAGAFVSSDYARYGLFRNKAYKWGYFPETKYYDNINHVLEKKKKNSILWAGRFIDWKHPDDALKAAEILKNGGVNFEMNFIGTGDMENDLKAMTDKMGLSDCVHFLGSMKPDSVREYMEKSEIFLFTSDRNEGWGAVLNEAMNSGCAVVASHEAGSVPYLTQNGENAFVYECCNPQMLAEKIMFLLNNPDKRKMISVNAYKTISEKWNASVASQRLIDLINHLAAGEKHPDIYKDGPCSKAELMKENWLKKL